MLYIMRHGKTDWNAKHKLQGRTDIPLNEEGIQMAEQAKEKYKGGKDATKKRNTACVLCRS